MLKGKTIVLGVTGGIACYKAAALASQLVKLHADVQVGMTENATKFITPLTFEQLTGHRVPVDTFDRGFEHSVAHIAIADRADMVLIAPATANVLAKLANGIADDMLTTTVLACDCPKAAAPAMNTKMYENPVTQDNLRKLRGYGWEIVEPASGRLACGAVGKGKLPEPEELVEVVLHTVGHEKDLLGRKVLVTAGPTREALDPVRYITNHSSGKMGYAIAKAASRRGAEVTLVSGQVDLKEPPYMDVGKITSAQEMFEAVTSRAPEMDIIIKAAAVADYRPVEIADNKIKKKDGDLSIPLARTKDILGTLGANKPEGQFLCGFAMETENLLANAAEKLTKKNADMIVANSLRTKGAGFGTDTNIVTILKREGSVELPILSKNEVADRILDQIITR